MDAVSYAESQTEALQKVTHLEAKVSRMQKTLDFKERECRRLDRQLKALNKHICSENWELNALTLAQAHPSMLLHSLVFFVCFFFVFCFLV